MDIPEIVYEHRLKVPVVRREHYTITLEEHIYGTFAHSDVLKWSPRIAKGFKTDWEQVTALHGGPIHVLRDCSDHKLRKFIEWLGFVFLQGHEPWNEIWIWRNNGKSL